MITLSVIQSPMISVVSRNPAGNNMLKLNNRNDVPS